MDNKTKILYAVISILILSNLALGVFTYRNHKNIKETVNLLNTQGGVLQQVVNFLNQAINQPK